MTVFLVPREGCLVRDPKTMQEMPKTGMLVELNSFWNRRIRDKSVIVSEQKKESTFVERKRVKEEKE